MQNKDGRTAHAERSFRRDLAELDGMLRFVDRFLADLDVGEEAGMAARLAVEELFTNAVKYGTGGEDRVDVSLCRVPHRLTVEVTEFGVEPFDPSELEPVDVGKPLEEREPGGLGIHLVRNLFDEVTWEHSDEELHITAVKHLES